MVIRINALPSEASPVSSSVFPIDGATTRKTTLEAAVNSVAPVASQAEAEAATDNVKRMTALRVGQYVANQLGDTIQAYDPSLSALSGVTVGAAGVSILALSLASDVRNFLDTAPYVATRTALKALDPTKDTMAFLTEGGGARGGRYGSFVWLAGDFTTQIAGDPNEGVYIEADSVAGSSGAWVRKDWAELDPHWFGCVGDGIVDDTSSFQACIDFVEAIQPERKAIALGNARYLVSGIVITEAGEALSIYGNGPYASQIISETLVAGSVIACRGQSCQFLNFRIQNASSVSDSFLASDVNTTTDVITLPSNVGRWVTGVKIQITTTGVLPGGISALTDYYVIRDSSTAIRLASSLANANLGTSIDLTSAGSGTHTIISTFDVSTLARDGISLTKDYGVSVPLADIDAEIHNCEISRFQKGVNFKGRGLRVENSLISVCYNGIALDWPSTGEYTAGDGVQEDLAGFRAIFITDNRFHSLTSSAITNTGTNAHKINGLQIAVNKLDIGRPLIEGHMGIGGTLIADNVINETPLEGMILTGGFDYLITGNTIAGSEGIAGGERIPNNFIKLTGTHDSGVIMANLFKRCNSHGIDIRSGTTTNMVIMNNTFLDPCRSVSTFSPVAFVGPSHTGLVKDNVIITSNSLLGVVRGNDASSSILTITNRVMGASVPDFVGPGQASNRGSLGSAASPYDTIYANRISLKDGVSVPANEAAIANVFTDTADGDLKVKFGDNTVKTIVVDT